MLAQQLANGVMLGSTYALVAIGYALVFGVLRILHLAHGEVFMVGAFVGVEIVLGMNVGPFVALIGGLVGSAVLGVCLELVAFRPIRRRSGGFLAPIVSSIGAGLVLQEVMTRIFGAEQIGFPPQLTTAVYRLGPVAVSGAQLFILAVALGTMLLLHLFVTRTRHGMAMRAAAESIEIASILGIDVDRVIMLTFAVASALAGIAGVLIGLAYNAISPYMGVDMTTKGLAIMLIGGLGSVYGAMAGGLLLGVVEIVSVAYLASSYRDAFAFSLMILVLLLRPRGLFATGVDVER
ncbi:MAG TPA: branched-chain amino acid ABC transporter permease [Xanthobacteraceae bacterium]